MRQSGKRVRRGFTLVEVMIVVAIIALLAAIAIPNVLRGRTSANESAAIGNLRALISSLEMFRSVNQQYPATGSWQANMYTDPTADPDFGPPQFNLALGSNQTIQGYVYLYNSGSAQTYSITADPQTLGRTGTRGFFTSEAGVVRHCAGVGATVTDNTIDTSPVTC